MPLSCRYFNATILFTGTGNQKLYNNLTTVLHLYILLYILFYIYYFYILLYYLYIIYYLITLNIARDPIVAKFIVKTIKILYFHNGKKESKF